MSIARTKIKGLAFLNSRLTQPGFTLFTPINDKAVYLIDMRGDVVHKWDLPYSPGAGAKLLPDGTLLYMGIHPDCPVKNIEGAGGILQWLDLDGNVLREYLDPYIHHEPIRLKNGNTLIMKWTPLADDFSSRVQGGPAGSEHNGVMYEDSLIEINANNRVVWEWKTSSVISPEEISRCVVCDRDTWLHMNGISETGNGNILLSYCKASQLAIINKKTKQFVWRYDSKGELAHQHCPTELSNGNILVFDNGLHPWGYSTDSTRIVEIDPSSDQIIWAYTGDAKGKLVMYFDSALYSSCQKLDNNDIVVCEGASGRLFEIGTNDEIIWEYVNPFPESTPAYSSSPVYSAYRYKEDYPGLAKIDFS